MAAYGTREEHPGELSWRRAQTIAATAQQVTQAIKA
jgi:hypothetical protein